MQGRLVGKRMSARLFVEDVAAHGAECCNYLLAVDVDMNTVDGYAISSWETGYGDMVMTPGLLARCGCCPWLPGTALVMADLSWDRRQCRSPRRRAASCNAQLDRLAERGAGAPYAATELEFIVFDDSYRDAWAAGYRNLHAGHRLQHRLRDAGLHADGAAAARHPPRHGGRRAVLRGRQGRVQLRPAGDRLPLRPTPWITCDNHAIYKNGAKEIADQHGKSLTFMAKFDEREGNSCHIHISLRGDGRRGGVRRSTDDPLGMSPMFRSFIAGQLATLRELTLFYAPNINSYKRFAEGSFAPDRGRVGYGQPHLRAAGGRPRRTACGWSAGRPGGDVNQYLAVSALIAGGLYGIEHELELPEALEGNAYASGAERLPTTLAEAAALFEKSEVAREAFGDDVVEHYLNNARVELAAFNAAVTDWERVRGFERL